jgi:capsular polysaccharide transport system permease protein
MNPEIRQDVASERWPALRFTAGALGVSGGVRLSLRRFAAITVKAAGAVRNFGRDAVEAESADKDQDAPWFWRSFVCLVIFPVATSLVYFQFLASDQFISETRFAVRGATESLIGADALAASGLGALGSLNVNQDVFILQEYIRSQKIIDDLSKQIDLRAIFSAPRADFIARFDPSKSSEDFLRYWRKAVDSEVAVISGILTLRVKTFSIADSVRLATAIRARCDAIINQLLDQMRRDMTTRGEAEVKVAMDSLAVRRARLEQFRNARMAIDPLGSAHSLSTTITDLRRELIEVEVKLASARDSLDPDSPQIKILASDRSILSSQIGALEGEITGASANPSTAAAALAEYDRLEVDKTLAEKRVTLAEKLLDNAREDANRRHIYLVSIEDPTTPQSSLFPRRGFAILMISLGAFTIWSVISLTVAGVRDHSR